MPQAVVSAGLADIIAPAARLGTELAQVINRVKTPPELDADAHGPDARAALIQILQRKTGFAFDQYKDSTMNRRIDRRMVINKLDALDDYINLIERSETEADSLFKEMQISVTGFFRDDAAFIAIADTIKSIASHKKPGEHLRIWVPGCATGEEAFSIAILVAEALGERLESTVVQIFATDIDASAITFARKSIYLKPGLNAVPERLFKKYFEAKDGDTYRVQACIRDLVVFAEHDLMRDPPFGRLDLISCRNVLIYFKRPAQERLLKNFHYVLNAGGFLVLGTSEGIGTLNDLFEPANQLEKLYTAKAVERIPPAFAGESRRQRPPVVSMLTTGRRSVEQQIQEALFDQYAPPSILVNSHSDIVHLHGELSPFMALPQGDITVNALELAVSPLRLELRLLLQKAQREHILIRTRAIELSGPAGRLLVTLVAVPVSGESDAEQKTTLVLFETETPIEHVLSEDESSEEADFRIRELEQELVATREHLETNIQEMEVSNEELQSMNEEFQSTTEELQSANEEFQTTNEELQSTNEELLTVNDALKSKTTELALTNSDLESILNTVVEAVVVLDDELRVTRYSADAKRVLDLMPPSIGQPLVTVGGPIDLTLLAGEIKTAMQSKQIVSRELQLDEIAYQVRLIPGTTGGLVISFIDETERFKAGQDERRLAAVVRDSNDAITVLDLTGQIIAWNRGAERLYGFDETEALAMNISDMAPSGQEEAAIDYLRQLMAGDSPESIEVSRRNKNGQVLHVWITATALRNEHGDVYAVATTERDLTERLADAVNQAKLDVKAQYIHERFEQLTSREREVMRLLVAGSATATSRQIAEKLGISVRTVDTHRRRIKEKMDARSMPDLVEKARLCGIYLPTSV
ncbi:PAS domain S-box protein [Granulosicoccus sp.]|nr:CheR family methyltransferase [Granulosicoccus sp.]MDB4223977.1 PAS domain S-box protein [Granulosicoccus sp.]